MASRYVLTLTQTKILQALGEAPELSSTEIAVHTQVLPRYLLPALNSLEQMKLVSSYYPITGRTGERIVTLTGEGHAVARALAQYRGAPPVGTVVPLPSGSFFSGWLTPSPLAGSGTPHILVAADRAEG